MPDPRTSVQDLDSVARRRKAADHIASSPVLIDAQFNAYEVKDLLKNRSQATEKKAVEAVKEEGQVELPITPDGELAPGVLYDSPNNQKLKYYLPEYVLRIVNTQYTTRLKFRDTDDDPHGPIAFLTIELVAAAPEDHRFTLKEIEHDAVVSLAYEVDISSEEPGPGVPSGGIDAFAGEWVNVDPATRGMTRLNIGRKTDRAGTFHGFGACHPQDCDWGEIPATFTGEQMTGVYRFSFKDTHITVRRAGENLHATVFNDYAESDHRSDRTDEYILRRTGAPTATIGEKPTLKIEIGSLEKVSNTVHRCQLPIHSKEEYDRLLQIMTDPGHNARLDVECQARMGYRTWRQIFVGNAFEASHQAKYTTINVNPAGLKHPPSRKDAVDTGSNAPDAPQKVRTDRMQNLMFTSRQPLTAGPITKKKAKTARDPSPAMMRVIREQSHLSAADMFRVSKEINRATPSKGTSSVRERTRVPSRVMVDERGKPVITRRMVSCVTTIQPFWFNVDTHAYMFDIPETPPTRHVLLRRDIFVGDISMTFYQDSILRDQVYYEPQAFRLARTDVVPHAPDLLFAFNDVSEEGEGDEVSIDYRVHLAYRVRAQIDQRFLAQARREFEDGVTFTALAPNEATLVMRLPSDEDESWIPVTRSEADISFNDGILDQIELTSAQFQKVFSAFQSPSSVGLEGTVEATLLDGSAIDIPVQVSLHENAGTLFDDHIRPAGAPGRYDVTLTNRIESRVNIRRVDAINLGSGAVAHPSSLSLPLGVEPGMAATITYEVTPPDAPQTSLTPVLETAIDVDYERLWGLVTTNEGFVNRTFDVKVSIDPQFFRATPAGMEPLTSVLVEFDSFVEVELSPEQTEVTVALRMPLLPVLLNQVDAAQTYRYRVTNQHASGPGASSERLIEGSGDLRVVPPRGD